MLFFGDSAEEPFVALSVACIDAIVTYLLKMLFRDMLDETVYEIKCGDSFHDQFVIFMAVIVEGDRITVIMVNAGSSDDGPAEIAADVFSYSVGVTLIGFSINIETVFVVSVDRGLDLFERRADLGFQFIQERSLEGIPHKTVAEVWEGTPEAGVTDTALGDEAVDVGIPFEVTAKGMEDTDKTGSKAFGFIVFVEHTENDAFCGSKKAVEEGTVGKEEGPELFRNGEDAVAVGDVQDLKGHGRGTVNGVFRTAGGTETAVAAERDKFEFTTLIAAIHGTTERRVTAVKHPVNVPNDGLPGMENVKHFFIMVFKDVLKNVHKIIMKDLIVENNPTPQD